MDKIVEKTGHTALKSDFAITDEMSEKIFIIPPKRTRYLAEIADNNRQYSASAKAQAKIAQELYSIRKSIASLKGAEFE